jgi:competence protein ComEC
MVLAQIFLWGWVAMVAGVGAASMAEISDFLFWVLAAAAVFLFFGGLIVRKHKIVVAGILLAGFVLGFWRFDDVWQKTKNNDLTKIVAAGQVMEINGAVAGDPVLGDSSQQIILKPDGVAGKILVVADRYPEFDYGDRIKFAAKLEAPQNFSDFDYQNYLAKDGIFAMARRPEIELILRNNGNPVFAGLLWIKHQLKQGIARALPAPHNNLMVAILLGDQSGLASCSSKELEINPDCAKLKEKLNIAGLRHLAAVSGAHVTIMAQIIVPFLIWLGWWRQKAQWAAIVFVWLFVAMIGLPASAVRAAIMGSLMILAQIIGRPVDILRVITIAAAAMVWQSPLILRFDVGFQLSFLAVLGMIYFARPIERKLKFIPPKPEFIRSALAVALAAQIFTLPLLVYGFGYVSTYGLVANVLVEPLVAFITIYGFVFAIAAAASQIVGWILFFPLWLSLSYLLVIANIFSQLPWAKLNFEIGFFWLALFYVVLGIVAHRIKKRENLEFLP